VDSVDDEVYYRMEPIDSAHSRKVMDVAETRKIPRNYMDYEMGEHLKSIKAGLPLFDRPGRRDGQGENSCRAPDSFYVSDDEFCTN
jgi:hypothetical protein